MTLGLEFLPMFWTLTQPRSPQGVPLTHIANKVMDKHILMKLLTRKTFDAGALSSLKG